MAEIDIFLRPTGHRKLWYQSDRPNLNAHILLRFQFQSEFFDSDSDFTNMSQIIRDPNSYPTDRSFADIRYFRNLIPIPIPGLNFVIPIPIPTQFDFLDSDSDSDSDSSQKQSDLGIGILHH